MLTGDINETIRYQQEDLIHLGRVCSKMLINPKFKRISV